MRPNHIFLLLLHHTSTKRQAHIQYRRQIHLFTWCAFDEFGADRGPAKPLVRCPSVASPEGEVIVASFRALNPQHVDRRNRVWIRLPHEMNQANESNTLHYIHLYKHMNKSMNKSTNKVVKQASKHL